jgi:hypothetical protein
MRAIEYLASLMQDFLNNKIAASDFGLQFENYLFDHEDEIYEHSEDTHNQVANVRDAIAYFQPDQKVREGYDYLLDEEQLRKVVQENFRMIQ